MNTLTIFIILNTINVVIQTIKSLLTIKGGKFIAALSNAIAYGFYTIVLIYMSCELNTITKALIVGIVNFIAVYFVKFIEQKITAKNDKSKYKVELTTEDKNKFYQYLYSLDLSYNYIEMQNNFTTFNIYDLTKTQIEQIKKQLTTEDKITIYKVA